MRWRPSKTHESMIGLRVWSRYFLIVAVKLFNQLSRSSINCACTVSAACFGFKTCGDTRVFWVFMKYCNYRIFQLFFLLRLSWMRCQQHIWNMLGHVSLSLSPHHHTYHILPMKNLGDSPTTHERSINEFFLHLTFNLYEFLLLLIGIVLCMDFMNRIIFYPDNLLIFLPSSWILWI